VVSALTGDSFRERYPDMVDWIEPAAMLHEARGNLREAIAWWERTLRFTESEDGFDDEGRDDIRGLIDRLRTKPTRKSRSRRSRHPTENLDRVTTSSVGGRAIPPCAPMGFTAACAP
jgi:hypothetical protein